MARSSKKRVNTDADTSPFAGLGSVFGGLDLPDLPEGSAESPPEPAKPKGPKPRVVIQRSTAHRGGKVVTVLGQWEPRVPSAKLEQLAKSLRQHCGCGGALKEGTIELQGEQAGKARDWLENEGFRVDGVR